MKSELILHTKIVAKGRPRFTRQGHIYTPQKTKDFEEYIRTWYKLAKLPMLNGAIRAEIRVILAPPKSTSKKNKTLMYKGVIRPTKRPDIDNMSKSILDALNGVAYADDSQIVDLDISKHYGENDKIVLKIEEIGCLSTN